MTAIKDDKPTSAKRHRRKIRFHERVQFKTIRHVSEFSEDEIKNGWYDKDDFNRMSENVSDIAKLVADGETGLNGEELCTRGLEHIVEEELADYRAEKMINSIDAVLDEQEEQWDEGKEEPGLIAELYAEYAKPLLREAHLIGLKDAEQGYKNWDDLLDEKQYQKLTIKRTTSPSLKDMGGAGKTEKIGKAKKIKKVKKSDDALYEGKHEIQRTKQAATSSNCFNTVWKPQQIEAADTKVKKKKIKESDNLPVQEQPSRKITTSTKKEESKKKVKRSRSQQSTDESLSSSSLQSSNSFQLSPMSSHALKNQGSFSSINSLSLKDLSMRSISEDFDTVVETEKNTSTKGKVFPSVLTKNNTTLLKSKQKPLLQRNGQGNSTKINKSIPQKKQRKTQPRRSAIDRKHGSELSPFVFRRDGTIAFRKPDVEKLKREQKDKRKNCILGSMSKFLHGDEEEEDFLAGILSNTVK